MNTKIVLESMAFGVAIAIAGGCVTTGESPYRDPTEARGRPTDFSSYDLQQCAAAAIDSMLSNRGLDQRLREQFPGRRPVIAVTPVRNETYQLGLRLDSMSATIRSRLVNSGKFDFVDRGTDRLVTEELVRDMESPLVADGEANGFKTQVAANYLLTGSLVEIRDGDGRTHDTYYKLTLNLLNKRTGMIDWSGEKELRKVSTRPAVGW